MKGPCGRVMIATSSSKRSKVTRIRSVRDSRPKTSRLTQSDRTNIEMDEGQMSLYYASDQKN